MDRYLQYEVLSVIAISVKEAIIQEILVHFIMSWKLRTPILHHQ